MSTPDKQLLVVVGAGPHNATRARDALDLVLTSAAFEIGVGILFRDDAVYQLLPQQQADAIDAKSLAANLQALPLYDVEQLYAPRSALEARGLDPDNLLLPVQLLDDNATAALLHSYGQILSF
ncbi:sulfurtransferase complex subunit TusC [Motiliproteus sediminis]|uniref:sulfurtransferase complex subunit TusC n=1 Tax=Motiliproteus sediminis TaxID=1468178 RepID=UPI001AEF828E|nr:sulfurtransferase complex subunit TusC [Motiliproteus sediminis]